MQEKHPPSPYLLRKSSPFPFVKVSSLSHQEVKNILYHQNWRQHRDESAQTKPHEITLICHSFPPNIYLLQM